MSDEREPFSAWLAFVAGALAGGAGAVLASAWADGRDRLDPRLIRGWRDDPHVPPTVVVPGILGSELRRPDGTQVWLNAGNALGYYDLRLPTRVPLHEIADELSPAGLLGVDTVLPRLFGFTEYADLLKLLEASGFRRGSLGVEAPGYHVFTYDWRRDLIESARRLGEELERLAEAHGDPELKVNLIGHSMGGLVARYYLRYGGAEPAEGAPVSWAGARRIRNLVIVASPNAGTISVLEALLSGAKVGFSSTTLAPGVIASMPAPYQLIPPAGAPALIDAAGQPLDVDLHDTASWERFGWGPWHPSDPLHPAAEDPALARAFLGEALARARALHRALARPPATPCPARVVALGGDCLPTVGRGVAPEQPGQPPRLEPADDDEARLIYEAGDGRVPRSSVLASHLAPGDLDAHHPDSGLPELSHAYFGASDHHGYYQEPTFQSTLLRLLLRPARRPALA